MDDGNESAMVTEFRVGLEDDFRRRTMYVKSRFTTRRTTPFTVCRSLDKLEICNLVKDSKTPCNTKSISISMVSH